MFPRAQTTSTGWARRRSFRPRMEALELRLNLTDTLNAYVSSPVQIGQPVMVTVQALTAQGTIDSSFSDLLEVTGLNAEPTEFTMNGTGGTYELDGPTYFTTGEFYLNFTVSDLTVPSDLNSSTTDFEPEVQVTATATQVGFQFWPSTVTAGADFGVVLAAEDDGIVVPGYTGSATLSLASYGSPGNGATLGGTTTETFVNGVASFSDLTIDQASGDPGNPDSPFSYTLQATSDGLSSMTEIISVLPAAPSKLVVQTQPPSDDNVAGGPLSGSVVVEVEDAYGNVEANFEPGVFNYSANLTIGTTSAAEGSLGGTLTVPVNSDGEAIFSDVVPYTANPDFTLQVSGAGLPTVTTSPFSVAAGTPTMLQVTTPPTSPITAGTTFGLSVSVEDAYGNPVSTTTGAVDLAFPAGIAPPVPASEPLVDGVATFSGLTIQQAASADKLVASYDPDDSSNPAPNPLTDADAIVSVIAAPASQLAVLDWPTTLTAGASFGLSIQAQDPYNNPASSYVGSAALALSGGPTGAVISGTLTVNFSNGIANFTSLTLDTAGTDYMLQVNSDGLTGLTIGPITVQSTAGTTTSGGSSGSTTGSGSSGGTTTSGDTPGGSDGTSTGGGDSGGTTSGGTTSGETTSGGTTSGGTSSGDAEQAGGTVDPSPRLAISDQPATVDAGRYFQLTVVAEDANGDVETGFDGTITLALADDPGGASLGGTLTMPVIDGLATFYGMTLDVAGSGYTIQAAAAGFAPVATSPITVVNPPVALAIAGPPPGSVGTRQGFGLTVAVVDDGGNLAPDYSGDVTIALARKREGVTLHGPRTVAVDHGVANFSGLSLTGARQGSDVELEITADGLGATMMEVTVGSAATQRHGRGHGRSRR